MGIRSGRGRSAARCRRRPRTADEWAEYNNAAVRPGAAASCRAARTKCEPHWRCYTLGSGEMSTPPTLTSPLTRPARSELAYPLLFKPCA